MCCGYRYEVRPDDTFLSAPESAWLDGPANDPFWESYWSPLGEQANGSLQGPFDSGGLHLVGTLRQSEDLLTIEVHDWVTSETVAAPFAVAGGRLYVAHVPRWTTQARVVTSRGFNEYSWIHRRYANYNSDMPAGINQIPAPDVKRPSAPGFGWFSYKAEPREDPSDL